MCNATALCLKQTSSRAIMVTIPFKSQYVSLTITAVSFVAETLFLSSLLKAASVLNHRRFLKSKSVDVCNHQRRSMLLTVASVVLFLALEVFVSFFAEPAALDRMQTGSCVSLDIAANAQGTELEFPRTGFIERQCEKLQNTTSLQHVGNLSEVNGRIMCSEGAVYKHSILDQFDVFSRPATGARKACASERLCAIVFQTQNAAYFSEPMGNQTASKILSGKKTFDVHYYKTELLFNATAMLETFALRAAQAYARSVTDINELRLWTFLGRRRTQCSFVSSTIDATDIPAFVVYVISVLWILSLACFILTRVLGRRVVFDVDDALSWAKYTERAEGVVIEGPPVLSFLGGKERPVFMVSEKHHVEFNNK
eukprot:TRINITY_DN55963_c0_g1_i1.p1 TRINITY_DN55963_c0_g1~~TRINITY_DN55963_c0_g1_i1.p1  ORF type:complete len:369 (+),score=58.06 TRINITY_DN55963_c0_g1_i1:235-1341(+)